MNWLQKLILNQSWVKQQNDILYANLKHLQANNDRLIEENQQLRRQIRILDTAVHFLKTKHKN